MKKISIVVAAGLLAIGPVNLAQAAPLICQDLLPWNL
jgi:hypothetical protein